MGATKTLHEDSEAIRGAERVIEASGKPTVKLSDNPQKATGPDEAIERYRRVFGQRNMQVQAVDV